MIVFPGYRRTAATTAIAIANLVCTLPCWALAQNASPVPVYHITRAESAPQARRVKLIEWGFDQPTPAGLRSSLTAMEKTPFDGVVLAAYGLDANGKPLDLAWKCWSKEPFTRDQFSAAVRDLKAIHSNRLTDNFLRINVTPGDVDWFDDAGWASICSKAAIASWLCSEGGLKGIMFDTEEYDAKHRIFYYQEQPGHQQKAFEAFRDQARKRGREFGAALCSVKADPTILFTYADAYHVLQENAPPPWSTLGLLPAFIDGMLEGAPTTARFVDALEEAYGAKDAGTLAKLKQGVKDGRKMSAIPSVYSSRMTAGFGLWIDKPLPGGAWNAATPATNYFQPEPFGIVLREALKQTDGYVWIYSEKINWWTGVGITDAYIQAIQQAKSSR